MKHHFDPRRVIVLTHESIPGLEFELLDRSRDTVPGNLATAPAGVIVTLDVEPHFGIGRDMGAGANRSVLWLASDAAAQFPVQCDRS